MRRKGSILFVLLVVPILFNGCQKERERECGCSGEDALNVIDDVGLVYNSYHGNVLISARIGLSFFCSQPQEVKEQKILFNGSTRSSCKKQLDSGIELNYLEISEFRLLTDDIVTIGSYKLSVIHPEDYGYPKGYG